MPAPYLSWAFLTNPAVGKLKLRSRERTNIFYEEWLHFLQLNGAIPDMSMGLFGNNPTSLLKNYSAKKVDVPKETTLINGIFEDVIGVELASDVIYTVKIFVWVETDEDTGGIVFDFQDEEGENSTDENKVNATENG